MLLINIKNHLQEQRVASLFELSVRFNKPADVLRSMLSVLIAKRQVLHCQKTNQCGTVCQRCNPLYTEIYKWNLGVKS